MAILNFFRKESFLLFSDFQAARTSINTDISKIPSHNFLRFFYNHVISYPTPITISYFWNLGSLASLCLVIQILSGLLMAMNYAPAIDLAFDLIERFVRDSWSGWFLRYTHANGAGFFLITIYLHIARGLYYRAASIESIATWSSGIVIYLLLMATAFLGYVSVFGQMSFWGSAVITSMLSAIPFIGTDLVLWVYGGPTVGASTLNRLYALHFALPFLIAFISILHLLQVHEQGSSNPFKGNHNGFAIGYTSFYPYFAIKDAFGMAVFLTIFVTFIAFFPDMLGHPDNYVPADPLKTPASIVPEFYFLPFYAVLRAVPDKLGGVIAMVGGILVFLIVLLKGYFTQAINLPFIVSLHFDHKSRVFDVFGAFLLLGWLGMNHPEAPYIFAGKLITIAYFISVALLAI